MTEHKQPETRLNSARLALFASPAIPIAAMGLPMSVHLPPFYVELGLSLSAVGLIFMLTRFWDVVTDPVLGFLSDRFPTKWGRRRPWIALSVPIMMVTVYLLFFPPMEVSGLYLAVVLFAMYVGWTMLTISHMSWGAELSDDYDERSRIQGYREAALVGGALLVLVLPVILESLGLTGEGRRGIVAAMGWFVLITLPLAVFFSLKFVPERRFSAAEKPPPFKDVIKSVMASRPLRRLLVIDVLGGLSAGTVASLFLYLAADVLKVSDVWANLMLLGYFLSGICFIPIIMKLSYRFGKHRTLAGSSLFSGLSIPVIYILPENEPAIALIAWIAFGVNMGAGSFLVRAITADIVDEDERRSGAKQTGVYYAAINLTQKIGIALSIGLLYVVLEQGFGYQPGQENTASAVEGLKLTYVIPPVLVALINAGLLWRFPLGKHEQEHLREEIVELGIE
ncbi:MAG: MFS transporter, partial [Alphaproteobacteria bacterium]